MKTCCWFAVTLWALSLAAATVSAQRPSKQPNPGADEPEPQASEMKTPIDETFLLFPAVYPEGNWKPPSLKFEDVWFESSDKVKLHAWYCPVPNPVATLVYFHGNAGNLSHRAEIIQALQAKTNCSVFIFDYRGYGRSQGTPAIAGILKDAEAAVKQAAKSSDTPVDQLIYLGRSLGGAIALATAISDNLKPPRMLIMESTFTSFRDIAKHHSPNLAWLVPKNKLNSAQAISEYHGQLVLSHSTQDEVVPYSMGEKLLAAANEPKHLIKLDRGGHNDVLPASYYQQLADLLNQSTQK